MRISDWSSDVCSSDLEPYPARNVARCVATRIGRGGEPGKPRPPGLNKFVVEFDGDAMRNLPKGSKPEPVIATSRGELSSMFAEPVPPTERWRMQFDLTVPAIGRASCRERVGHYGQNPV